MTAKTNDPAGVEVSTSSPSGLVVLALWAAAYAIKAARAAAPPGEAETAGRAECRWQRAQVPEPIGELVLEDERRRNETCWSVFDC